MLIWSSLPLEHSGSVVPRRLHGSNHRGMYHTFFVTPLHDPRELDNSVTDHIVLYVKHVRRIATEIVLVKMSIPCSGEQGVVVPRTYVCT